MSNEPEFVELTSPATEWATAFVAFQKDMPEIAKTKTANIRTSSGSYSYSYADLPDIVAKIRPALVKHGLGFAQSVEPGTNGVSVTTRIYHESGHVETFGPLFLPSAADAQKAGSAITYARRYSLCAALGIAADEDDDANSSKIAESTPVSGSQTGNTEPTAASTSPGSAAPPRQGEGDGRESSPSVEDLLELGGWADIKPIMHEVLRARAKEGHFEHVPRDQEHLGDLSPDAIEEIYRRLSGKLAI